MNKQTQIFPTLYGTSSSNKVKIYNIRVEDNIIIMEHGYETGKLTVQKREAEIKNKGKANETSPFTQAVSEAQSKWNKKVDEGYTQTKVEQQTQKLILPMLAHKYTERKSNITFPCFVQPKLDGVRCLTELVNDNPLYISRGGHNDYKLDHLNEDSRAFIRFSDTDVIIDGEIYTHGELTFQEITSAVKKVKPITTKLKYYIYDLAIEHKTFAERKTIIDAIFEKNTFTNFIQVPTYVVNNEKEIIQYHQLFVQQGYEGVMIRNTNGLYSFNQRSKDLQKWKFFDDAEFIITGGKEATGEDKGTVIFTCKTNRNVEFDVRPRGSREQRSEWLQNINKIISKQLTVRYQGFTDSGIPRFPVGIVIRDY